MLAINAARCASQRTPIQHLQDETTFYQSKNTYNSMSHNFYKKPNTPTTPYTRSPISLRTKNYLSSKTTTHVPHTSSPHNNQSQMQQSNQTCKISTPGLRHTHTHHRYIKQNFNSTRHIRRTLPQLRCNHSPFLKHYLHKINPLSHASPLCPLFNTHPHTSTHLFSCTSSLTLFIPGDLWTRRRSARCCSTVGAAAGCCL